MLSDVALAVKVIKNICTRGIVADQSGISMHGPLKHISNVQYLIFISID